MRAYCDNTLCGMNENNVCKTENYDCAKVYQNLPSIFTMSEIEMLSKELEKCYSEIAEKDAFIAELKSGNSEYSEFFEDNE